MSDIIQSDLDVDQMIPNLDLVSEDFRVDDLLDLRPYLDQFEAMVNATNDISLIGIVGAYGTGKSVMLDQFKRRVEKDCLWVHLDAWKYPERKDLWEGFVLEFAKQIKPALFEQVLKKLDGTDKKDLETLIKTVAVGANIFLPSSGDVLKKLTHFTRTSPATRIFQIQSIFENLLKDVDEDIYIVAEDVDRSGTAGLYFIETLNQFLKALDITNKVKVFVPISDDSYKEHPASYIKALDYIEPFSLSKRSLSNFCEAILNPRLMSVDYFNDNIVEIIQRLINEGGLTLRSVKMALRMADSKYQALRKHGMKPDPRIVLMMQAAHFHDENLHGNMINSAQRYKKRMKVEADSPNSLILYAIANSIKVERAVILVNNNSVPGQDRTYTFSDVDRVDPKTGTELPFYSSSKGEHCLNERYLI